MEIQRGKCKSPLKVVVYGVEGIGKTTFAMQFPNAVFCDVEGSTKHYNVARFESITTSWDGINECIAYAYSHPEEVGTFVLDTADWADIYCQRKACEEFGAKGIEQVDGGYGKGYVYVAEKFHNMLLALEKLLTKGINVVITAHAQIKKIEQPEEVGGYDHWELKCSKKIAPILKEWADVVLFANYKTVVYEADKTKTKKATGGQRVMYTTHTPWWDAKNRLGLPDQMSFEYSAIAPYIEGAAKTQQAEQPKDEPKKEEPKKEEPQKEEPKAEMPKGVKDDRAKSIEALEIPEELKKLMLRDNLTEFDIQGAVSVKGYYSSDVKISEYDPSFVQGVLIGAWEQVSKLAKEARDKMEIPFN